MDIHIQLKIDSEINNLDVEQYKSLSHDLWLAEQVNVAFKNFDSDRALFFENDDAKAQMEARKIKIRNR
jgi:hypothetical protein